jgi:carbon monoxide dehydrogenase subunit G
MKALLAILILASMTGCRSLYVTYDRYAADGKTKVSTLSVHSRGVLYKTLAPKVTFNADGSASMEGYSSDAGQAAVSGAIEAACKGAVKGVTGK